MIHTYESFKTMQYKTLKRDLVLIFQIKSTNLHMCEKVTCCFDPLLNPGLFAHVWKLSRLKGEDWKDSSSCAHTFSVHTYAHTPSLHTHLLWPPIAVDSAVDTDLPISCSLQPNIDQTEFSSLSATSLVSKDSPRTSPSATTDPQCDAILGMNEPGPETVFN